MNICDKIVIGCFIGNIILILLHLAIMFHVRKINRPINRFYRNKRWKVGGRHGRYHM